MKFRIVLLFVGLVAMLSNSVSAAYNSGEIGYRRVPDPLTTVEGEKIQTAEQWQQIRRPEVLDLFREHIYGWPSVERPDSLQFNIVDIKENMMDGNATRKQIDISYEGPGGEGEFRLLLFVPSNVQKPVPTFLFINNRGYENMDPDRETKTPFWPAEYIVDRGYATAVFQVSEVAPDSPDSFQEGVHGIFDPEGDRPSNAWGTIAAWAWGASRAMDYLETDPDIDSKWVAVVGHSRGGKAALWAGATDERFDLVVSNDSGSTGAAIARGKMGETIEQINTRFPHWFNENYKTYNNKEYELPVDQHMLIASIAPRLVYVASASEDTWADPESEFLSLVYAQSVYQLFGLEGLGTHQFPENDSPLHGDGMGYHVRTGEHDLTVYDWKNFIDFWEPSSASDLKKLVSRFEEDGEFTNDKAPRSLQLHLTAVGQFEKQEVAEKVIRYMESFKQLLDNQKKGDWISERAYNSLIINADKLIEMWK